MSFERRGFGVMNKLKILFNIYLQGNLEALIAFYYRHYYSHPKYKNVRITLTGGFEIYNKHKWLHYVQRVSSLARSYDVIVTDFPTRLLLKGKTCVYMSHGYGTKKTPGNDEVKDPRKMSMYAFLRKHVEYIVTLSPRDETYFLRHPCLEEYPLPCYLPLGLPRNDVLFTNAYLAFSRERIIREIRQRPSKIILYAPTWRGYKVSVPLSRRVIIALDKMLRKNNWVLIYRPHYMETSRCFNYGLQFHIH